MSNQLEEIPLFPLNTVLFPYASLQLHIFEERYREMVRSCLDLDTPFGIVLIRNGSEVGGEADPYLVGTAVRIQQVHHYEDGRMDILVQGERRFRIRGFDESRNYLVGLVEPVIEMEIEELDRAADLFGRARDDFEALVQRMFAHQEVHVQVRLSDDPIVLSFTIANMLNIENLEKQRLLETTNTVERMADLIPMLEAQLIESQKPSYFRIGTKELSDWIHPN
jgi:Lon protease-like protein